MLKKINAVIVDDELSCIANLKHYLSTYCPLIEVVGSADTPEDAVSQLNRPDLDVAFLDVELLSQDIFTVLDQVRQRRFAIVFVTAHERYALPALRASALDYLLKPLERSEIIRCYQKLLENRQPAAPVQPVFPPITLKQGERFYVLTVNNIVSLNASGFYTNIIFEHHKAFRSVKIAKPIQLVFEEYGISQLLRVHRSYAVNPVHIRSIRKIGAQLQLQMNDGQEIPVAKRKTKEFLERYKG